MLRSNIHRLVLTAAIVTLGACDPGDVDSTDDDRSGSTGTTVPLVGRRVNNGIRIYEPFEADFHPSSAATTIPGISGLWVHRPALSGEPDLWHVLEYLDTTSTTPLKIELTWVGLEAVTAASGTQSWSASRFPATGPRVGTVLTSPGVVPVDGRVTQGMTVGVAGGVDSFTVWLDQGEAGEPEDPGDDDLRDRVPPTPIPVPVPSPTPTG